LSRRFTDFDALSRAEGDSPPVARQGISRRYQEDWAS
jgi:hypothetical protein